MPKQLTQGQILRAMHEGETLTKIHINEPPSEAKTVFKVGGRTVRAATVAAMLRDHLIVQIDGGLFGDDPHTYRLATGEELKAA